MVSVCLCKVFAKGASSVMMKTREKKPTLSRPSPPFLPIAQPQQREPVKISGDGGNLISDIGRQFSILFHGGGGGDKKKWR